MNKIARLGLCLVALVLIPALWFPVATVVAGNTPLIGVGGVTVVILPFVIVAAASIYTVHRAFYAEMVSRMGKIVFHVLNVVASLLLTVLSAGIAGFVQIGIFGF